MSTGEEKQGMANGEWYIDGGLISQWLLPQCGRPCEHERASTSSYHIRIVLHAVGLHNYLQNYIIPLCRSGLFE